MLNFNPVLRNIVRLDCWLILVLDTDVVYTTIMWNIMEIKPIELISLALHILLFFVAAAACSTAFSEFTNGDEIAKELTLSVAYLHSG